MVGYFDGGGAVGLPDDFNLFGGGFACFFLLEFGVLRKWKGFHIPKLLVRRMENSPDGGGAIERGILVVIGTCWDLINMIREDLWI